MKILLAEDDNNISTIAVLTLEQIGKHQVELATDGRTALEKALANKYDLILLDEMMPHMNGLSVCQEYKKQSPSPSPVIFLSANSQAEDIENFNKHGHGHIQKPFDPMQLCQKIVEILEPEAA